MSRNQQISVGAAATDTTNWAKLSASTDPRGRNGGAQIAKVCVRSSASPSASFVLTFILVDDTDTILAAQDATCTLRTLNPTRDVLAGGSGNYVYDVVFAESGNSKFDLAGNGTSSTGNGNAAAHWRVGVASYGSSGITSCIVNVIPILDV